MLSKQQRSEMSRNGKTASLSTSSGNKSIIHVEVASFSAEVRE
jgi:hypothetical protein